MQHFFDFFSCTGYIMTMKKLLIALPFLILLTTCDFGNYYAEYEGVNLIESQSFSSADWTVSDPVYLDFSSIAAEADAGTFPPGAADVHRLEVLNLVANGDFEGALAGSWTNTGGIMNTSGVSPIYGDSLYFDLSSDQRIDYNLTHLIDGFIDNGLYFIRFSFKADSDSLFEYNDGSSFLLRRIITKDEGVRTFPVGNESNFSITAQPTAPAFSIGTVRVEDGFIQDGYMDNLRITRKDTSDSLLLSLSLPYADPAEARPDLISGNYTLSLFVKSEIPDQLTPLSPNRFPSESITLKMNNAYAVHNVTSDWTRVSVQGFFQIDPPADPASTVITLSVTPMNINYVDVGSLLIAAPELRFSPDR